MKIKPGDIISLHLCTINDIWFLRYGVWQNFCLFCAIFSPFTPLTTQKLKVLKWKNNWSYYHFTHVYQRWQSHDLWLLRYGAWQTEFFVILGHFLNFFLPNNNRITKILNPNNKNENKKPPQKTPANIIILHKAKPS